MSENTIWQIIIENIIIYIPKVALEETEKFYNAWNKHTLKKTPNVQVNLYLNHASKKCCLLIWSRNNIQKL